VTSFLKERKFLIANSISITDAFGATKIIKNSPILQKFVKFSQFSQKSDKFQENKVPAQIGGA
jgi:hypothetical protein